MDLKRTAVSLVGCVAIGIGLTSGIAFAADNDTIDMTLSVSCSELTDIEITGNGAFESIDIALGETSSQTAPNALQIDVEKGCDFGPWHVDAEISRFDTGAGLLGPWFAGDYFSLTAGPVTSYYGDTLLTDPPTASSQEFEPIPGFPIGDAGSEAPIFETTNILFFGFPTPFDYPAPFESTALFTGNLDNLDDLPLVDADYEATLTVILVND